MNNLKNKVIWITGSSSGFGEILAYEFANQGAKIILSGRNEEALNKLKSNISNSKTVIFDIEDTSLFQFKINEAISAFGHIDMIIHNAGVAQNSEALSTQEAIEDKILQINYLSPILLTKAILPHFIDRKEGTIVVVSGLLAYLNLPGRSTYAATKAALSAYFGCLRTELQHMNIRVSVLIPGSLHTNLVNKALTSNGSIIKTKKKVEGYPLEKAAKEAIHSIAKGKYQIYVGGRKEFIMWKLYGLYPNYIISKILQKTK